MSFLRTSAFRLSRTMGVRGYANKTMTEKAGETMKKVGDAFKGDGAVGEKFQADGAVGSKGEAVGGPFSKDGAIGSKFTGSGSVGGSVDQAATEVKKTGQEVKQQK